ncbi:uncharacterized protein MEPE_01478 [Melanopsichium pennsylvanicum]|uniref:Uncharacterized protein n=2 Tax=Melanopsichium pennsylvanicum TaxID=63383 RepID=A0AAJ5C3N6_9BASI|nr:putative protein [Melanopsichium pennsylvanicum 4]SNX82772.1 uncharacterized protein MEPE_01478 [Melanopsichium pennsylvanicum]
MSQPNTAAIAVASIFGGVALMFVAYKTYRKIWNCMHRPEQLPPISQPPTAYHGGVVVSALSQSPTMRSINRTSSSPDHLAASNSNWQQHDGLTSTCTSEIPSPSIQGLDSIMLSSPSDVYDPHYRGASTISSSSSTMTLKRSYLKSPSASQLSYTSNSSRRESYLPHSPLYRESIQIIPPQPLGFGGSSAMATDQKTLAFSNSSGIGTPEDFTSGLVWTEQPGHGRRSRNSQRPQLAHQDRQRYLMQGPLSARNSEVPSLLTSSRNSPVAPNSPLEPPADVELSGSTVATSQSSQAKVHSQPRLEPKSSVINSHLLGAKDSPLQRLQSSGGQVQPILGIRSPSEHGNRSDSDASPILSPFEHRSSPSSAGDGAPSTSSACSSADAGASVKT